VAGWIGVPLAAFALYGGLALVNVYQRYCCGKG
jgi:hypothetical protein